MLRDSQTDKRRTRIQALPESDATDTAEYAPDQGLFEWARQDSNLRPTDYESAALTN